MKPEHIAAIDEWYFQACSPSRWSDVIEVIESLFVKTGRPSWRDGSGALCHLEKRVSRATGKVHFVGVPFGVALEEETFAKALVQSQFTSWLDDRDICVNSLKFPGLKARGFSRVLHRNRSCRAKRTTQNRYR